MKHFITIRDTPALDLRRIILDAKKRKEPIVFKKHVIETTLIERKST